MSALPPLWHDPASKVPRRDQVVRVLTTRGIDHEAQFVVHHTDDWPSGAAWALVNGRAWLRFGEVLSWSPDLRARPPGRGEGGPEPEGAVPSRPPAILAEVVSEVGRTGSVLRLLPADHLDWSPHPDIPTLRTLALRLVRIVARIGWILELDEVVLEFEPDLPYLETVDEIMATYAANEETVEELAKTVDADALRAPWRLEKDESAIARMTRGDALRVLGLTPIVYHRGETALMLTALGIRPPHPYPLWAFDDDPVTAV